MKKNIKNRNWQVPRTIFRIFFFCLAFLFIVYSYISLSPKVLGIDIKAFALTRNTYSTVLKAKRGTIYDSTGNTLALNVYSYTVIAYLSPSRTTNPKKPMHVVDVDDTAKKLSPILNMSEQDLKKLLSLEGRYQVELGPGGRNITELKKDEIEKLNLPGIGFIESSKRFYPNGDFASYVIGYAKTNEYEKDGKKEKVIDGELGIEAKYDEALKGKDGSLSYQQDANGYQIPETKEERTPAIDGNNIYLTIDSTIQRFLEEAFDNASSNFKFEWLQMHIMDATTGDIVASSKSPSFDPNTRETLSYENNLTNVPIEPGSVMKTFTYICAMEKGTYDGDKKFKSGSIEVGDVTVKDWNKKGWGEVTYDFGYEQSSNVGIASMILNDKMINDDDLRECLEKYGFGSTTGIELTESSGKVNFYYPVEVAAAGYGQGIYVTPIQILKAYSMIANNGKALTPHLINKIVDSNTDKTIYQRKVEETDQLISSSTIERIKGLMYNVVNSDTGSGASYSLLSDGISLIGKTGTGEIFENGRYLGNQYIRSFAGMFPKENPKYIIYAAVKKVNPDANTVLTRTVKSVIKNIAKYYSLATDTKSIPEYKVGNYINKNVDTVVETLKSLGIEPIIIGDGKYIIKQNLKVGSTILKGEKIFLLTNSEEYIMPNMNKWSRADVISYFSLLNIPYNILGDGYVVSQSIEKGKKIDSTKEITLELKNKYE